MISPARKAAVSALRTWRQRGMIEIPACEHREDTHLAERIVLGVLQNERFLEYCLSQYIPSGLNKLHPQIRDILKLSAYQILFLDRIPDSASIHDAVSLCRTGKAAYSAGFVNAVLRNLVKQKEQLISLDIPAAVLFSHPDWLVERLLQSYDPEFVLDFLETDQKITTLRLQINTHRCSVSDFIDMLERGGFKILSVNSLLSSIEISGTEVPMIPGYSEGLFYIQDDAARTAVRIAEIRSGMKVLDACAAPGGKSIAAVLDGGEVTARDINERRMKRCQENFKRMKLNITAEIADATICIPSEQGQYDVVIADVPCSGTGVIRKHPEIRYRTEAEVKELTTLQRAIINNLSRSVSPGGILLYSTCSVLPEENEEQVEFFLNTHKEFILEPVSAEGFSCENGMLRSWPNLNANDGFFAAKLRRKND